MADKIEVRLATTKDSSDIEAFLIGYADGKYDDLARAYIRSSFSQDFRRPYFCIAWMAKK